MTEFVQNSLIHRFRMPAVFARVQINMAKKIFSESTDKYGKKDISYFIVHD